MGFSDLVHKVLGTADKLLVQDLPHDTREAAALVEDAGKIVVTLDPQLESLFQAVGEAGNLLETGLADLGKLLGELKAEVAKRPVPVVTAPAPVGAPSEPPPVEPPAEVPPPPAAEPPVPPETPAAPMEVGQADAPPPVETPPPVDPDPVPDAQDAPAPPPATEPSATPPPAP